MSLTKLNDKHASFLRTLAKNTNNRAAIKGYVDFLQDEGNPGWPIVLWFEPRHWMVEYRRYARVNGLDRSDKKKDWEKLCARRYWWKLPWLDGWVECGGNSNALTRLKAALNLYAIGDVHEAD